MEVGRGERGRIHWRRCGVSASSGGTPIACVFVSPISLPRARALHPLSLSLTAPPSLPPRPRPIFHKQFPLLVPADGSAPITGLGAILAALGGPGAAPADGAAAEQWTALASAVAGPAAALVEPVAGERAAKDGEADAAVAELKR